MNIESRHLIILNLLNNADRNRIESRTRLQKLVFLTQAEHEDPLPEEYQFVAFDYGPFAPDLIKDIEYLEKNGWLTEHKESKENIDLFMYTLTEEGKQSLTEELALLPETERDNILTATEHSINLFNDIPLTRLLEHVHNNYKKYTRNSVL